MIFLCQSIKIKPTNITIPEHDTAINQIYGYQYWVHEINYQINALMDQRQPGDREFNPRRIHDNLSVPLWVYMCFPVP